MKTHVVFLSLYALASSQTVQPLKPTLTPAELSPDRATIYHQFLTSNPALAQASASTLNVSLVTEPFLYKSYVDPDLSCLSSAHIFDLATPDLHKLPAEAFASDRIHLVDLTVPPPPTPPPTRSVVSKLAVFHHAAPPPPQPQRPDSLITLSEIVFDDSHTHAAFRYTYTSSPAATKGATVIYDLNQGTWKASPSTCSEWAR